MDQKPTLPIRHSNGDLLIPAPTAEVVEQTLRQIQQELETLQGQSCVAPGQMETRDETARRQEFVDNLSASVGVTAPTVMPRRIPDTEHVVESSVLLEQVRALVRLLFGKG